MKAMTSKKILSRKVKGNLFKVAQRRIWLRPLLKRAILTNMLIEIL